MSKQDYLIVKDKKFNLEEIDSNWIVLKERQISEGVFVGDGHIWCDIVLTPQQKITVDDIPHDTSELYLLWAGKLLYVKIKYLVFNDNRITIKQEWSTLIYW